MTKSNKSKTIQDSILLDEVSKMIKSERIANRFSQMELAERSNCSRNTVFSIENGAYSTKITTCNRLAIALGYGDIWELHEIHSNKPKMKLQYNSKQKTINRIDRYLSLFTNDELNSLHKLIESFAYSKMKSDEELKRNFELENNLI